MARYFFHVRDGTDKPDSEGTDLPNDGAARSEAVVAMGEALKDLDGRFWESREWRMVVTDITGATVCTLKVSATT